MYLRHLHMILCIRVITHQLCIIHNPAVAVTHAIKTRERPLKLERIGADVIGGHSQGILGRDLASTSIVEWFSPLHVLSEDVRECEPVASRSLSTADCTISAIHESGWPCILTKGSFTASACVSMCM